MFRGHLDYLQKPPIEGKPNTKPRDHGTLNTHNRWFILIYHIQRSAWIEIHWNSIWLRAQSHMTSHYTWGSVTTLHDFGGVLGRPLDTFFWTLTISWSRLLARVWSGPKPHSLLCGEAGRPVNCEALNSACNHALPFPPYPTPLEPSRQAGNQEQDWVANGVVCQGKEPRSTVHSGCIESVSQYFILGNPCLYVRDIFLSFDITCVHEFQGK